MDWMHVLWLVVALVIAGVVMITGVLDLIWLAVAALVAFAVGWILPAVASPLALLIVFAVSAAALILVGRFVRMPKPPDTGLNQRSARLVGQTGTVLDDFDNSGRGRITVDDLNWTARAADPTRPIVEGDMVEVIAANGVTLIVAPVGKEAGSVTPSGSA